MKKIDKTKIERILVITLSNAGDIILTTPVIRVLLREFPDAALDVMVGPVGREIFEHDEKIRGVMIYDKKTSPVEKFRLFIALRKKRYNLVVDLRNTVLTLVLGAKFNTGPFKRGLKKEMHKKDVHLFWLQSIGVDISGAEFHIPVTEKDEKNVDALLGELKEKPFVAVSPGAKSHVKRWPLKNFARLCDEIKEKLGLEIVIIGDQHDRVVMQRISHYMKTKALNLIEKTNIRELAYLIKKAKLLITNDSAPLHIASAVGAKVLTFFGPTDERKYGPLTKNKSMVLRKNLKCSPCEVAQCVNTNNKYECLKTISVEEAFSAAKELLRN